MPPPTLYEIENDMRTSEREDDGSMNADLKERDQKSETDEERGGRRNKRLMVERSKREEKRSGVREGE